MLKNQAGEVVFSPSDLIRYLSSPFASWMDRFHLEHPGRLEPDPDGADQRLIQDAGNAHERAVLAEFRASGVDIVSIDARGFDAAHEATIEAFDARRPLVYQAALRMERFQGYADFVELCPERGYLAWDTKLARSPKPYYVIQLCAYSEMLEELTGRLPSRFGVILGTQERVEFRLEEFFHYYRRVKANMLAAQDAFTGRFEDRPEPQPRADHGRWSSHAEAYFEETDHLVRVAGITTGQIKKLKRAGIGTMTKLARASGTKVPKLSSDTLEKLAAQARLQCGTLEARAADPACCPEFEVLPKVLPDGRPNGLSSLPRPHAADVFFDMEGYPLVPGGLEYLFGLVTREEPEGELTFKEWWAHDREQERAALEGFVDFVHARWRDNPGMRVYHYAPYEVSAVRRLSTRHDTRQEEVDALLRAGVFVDLYQTVRQGLLIGEDSYSIKRVEHLYRAGRSTDVATAVDSIVQYANWIASGEPQDPAASAVLKGIRDYNEDDCVSTAQLRDWLLGVAGEHGLLGAGAVQPAEAPEERPVNPDVLERAELAAALRRQGGVGAVLGDVIDYHRREDKPVWWRMFDRAEASEEELRDDPGCIAGLTAVGEPEPVKQSLQQWYSFDPNQECKLSGKETVMFSHNLGFKPSITALDSVNGRVALKAGKKALGEHGGFPPSGSLIPHEVIDASGIVTALTHLCRRQLEGEPLPAAVSSLLSRTPPAVPLRLPGESEVAAAQRVTAAMDGGCLVIQGPPGTGKTFTASRAIARLLAAGKRVGITSNSHKAILNLMGACGEALEESGGVLVGIKAGGERDDAVAERYPGLRFVAGGAVAHGEYEGGLVGGTAWLFSRDEWEGGLDYLFIDEAGQVPLANAVAVARCARNLVLLGDQMQLEQPVQGTHPGDAGMSVLQYALKDDEASRPDAPVFYPVIPPGKGLFLGTSRRMHPDVCRFISESIYEGRLAAFADCERQRVELGERELVGIGAGVQFSAVEHDGNVQRSEEEVERVLAVFEELRGRPFTNGDGVTRPLALEDFLFIAPYNAQVRALKDALPVGAKVGSVDRFQGQEAPVTVLSLCSSAGEYGSRGLGFILDRNRVNVAISRAKCLAVVVADPRIADTLPGSIEEMRLLNLFCKALGE